MKEKCDNCNRTISIGINEMLIGDLKMVSQARQYKRRKQLKLKPVITEFCDECYFS